MTTGEESLGKPVIHADLYDIPTYARLLNRLIEARYRSRSDMRVEPKYVILTEEEKNMFLLFGTKEIPEKVYGMIVLTKEEVIFS